MDKEKEIDDTEEVIEFENDALVWCEELQNICCGDEISCANCIARHLYEAGYRKADVVRKKTGEALKNMLQELYDMCFELKYPYIAGSDEIKGCVTADEILWYAKEMGVEIEE